MPPRVALAWRKTTMSSHPAVRGFASSLRRRFRHRWHRADEPLLGEVSEGPSPAAVVADPVGEELIATFRQQIRETLSRPDQEAFLRNDLNHARRYALSLGWIPDGEGRLLDPASGAGHFTR